MDANYQKLPFDIKQNLHMDFWVKADYFGFHWHYHPEVEICYVQQGYGQRIVGESVERFTAGDLVLLGSNLPHCWISDDSFNALPDQMEVFVIHLNLDKMRSFLQLREFAGLDDFLQKSVAGFAFDTEQSPSLIEHLLQFAKGEGLSKSLDLLGLLDNMMRSQHRRQLCTANYLPDTSRQVEARIQKVCLHIHQHFRRKISLAELADLAHMNASAFCRFFKKIIGKTPIEYINELRINTASHELLISDQPINQIALQQGFASLSQFNKLFRQYNQQTPSQYRKGLRRARLTS
ncbi:MAG: AraC family transcriptional regulator [Bacteroidota bacterium]